VFSGTSVARLVACLVAGLVAYLGGVLVIWRRIEFVAHGSPPRQVNAWQAAAFRFREVIVGHLADKQACFYEPFLGIRNRSVIPHSEHV
jgi:hypothetical protein